MDRKIGRQFSDEPANPHVLHDGGVHAGGNDRTQIIFRINQFILENQRVERGIPFDPATVQKLHEPRQAGCGEIVRPHPRVEFFEAEINRIRAVFDGGPGALPVARRCKQFGQTRRFGHALFAFQGFGWSG